MISIAAFLDIIQIEYSLCLDWSKPNRQPNIVALELGNLNMVIRKNECNRIF